jgi:hypothetical protein
MAYGGGGAKSDAAVSSGKMPEHAQNLAQPQP